MITTLETNSMPGRHDQGGGGQVQSGGMGHRVSVTLVGNSGPGHWSQGPLPSLS